jgi:hypothetical protein
MKVSQESQEGPKEAEVDIEDKAEEGITKEIKIFQRIRKLNES